MKTRRKMTKEGFYVCIFLSLVIKTESFGIDALNEANKNALLDKYSLINSTGFFGMKISLSALCDFIPLRARKMENGL